MQNSSLWSRLKNLIVNVDDVWCLFGDFNEVRGREDRMNAQINEKEASDFNDFTRELQLNEIPLGGRKFTRISDDGLKFSKLDRFLVTDEFKRKRGNLVRPALEHKWPDHHPIGLKDMRQTLARSRSEPLIFG